MKRFGEVEPVLREEVAPPKRVQRECRETQRVDGVAHLREEPRDTLGKLGDRRDAEGLLEGVRPGAKRERRLGQVERLSVDQFGRCRQESPVLVDHILDVAEALEKRPTAHVKVLAFRDHPKELLTVGAYPGSPDRRRADEAPGCSPAVLARTTRSVVTLLWPHRVVGR